jgi:hypothetical protein
LKGEPLQCERLRFGYDCGTRLAISQQVKADSRDFANLTAFAASLWKCNSFNRAVAANANGPAEKRVACHLAGHVAVIQLQNKFMPGHNAQIIRI